MDRTLVTQSYNMLCVLQISAGPISVVLPCLSDNWSQSATKVARVTARPFRVGLSVPSQNGLSQVV